MRIPRYSLKKSLLIAWGLAALEIEIVDGLEYHVSRLRALEEWRVMVLKVETMEESVMILGNGDPLAPRAQVVLKTPLKSLSFGSLHLPRETTNELVRQKRCDRIPKVFSALIFA